MNEVITLAGYDASWWGNVLGINIVLALILVALGITASLVERDWEYLAIVLAAVFGIFFLTHVVCLFVYGVISSAEDADQKAEWLQSEGYTNVDVSGGDWTAADPDGKFTEGTFIYQHDNKWWVVTRDD